MHVDTQIFCSAPMQVNYATSPHQSAPSATAAAPKPAKPKPEVQQDRVYMTFKTTGILPAHLTMLCRKLIQVGWIAKDTQPDDFCNLFRGKTNNAKVTWTGAVGKGMLVFLFKQMVEQQHITVPQGHTINTILEAHVLDKNGKYITGLNKTTVTPKHYPIVKECLDILQLDPYTD